MLGDSHLLSDATMKKKRTSNKDELRPEYDLKKLLKTGVRGKYVERFRKGTNSVLLEPDIAKVFSDARAVNEAPRLVIQLTEIRK